MLISLGSFKILNEIDLHYLKVALDSHKSQTSSISFYLGIYCLPNRKSSVEEIMDQYSDVKYIFIDQEYYFSNLLSIYDNFIEEIENIDNCWILFSEFGIWHRKRSECFNNCLQGMENFKAEERDSVKYIRIPRSVYTGEKFVEKDDYSSIDKLLSEGQIVANENSSWGEVCEYVVRNTLFKEFITKFKKINSSLLTRPNCGRYFLKYLNCNQFKFLHLNTEKITIDFWMFFYFYNEPNTYFKPTKDLEIYEDCFRSIIKKDLIPQKSVIYEVGSKVTTKLGPGIISKINDNKYFVDIKWESSDKETTELTIQDLHQFDQNESRKGLYIFVANLLNNIELYLTNYVFTENDVPRYENFRDIISQFIAEGKEKLKSDNLFEKLGTFLDYREKILDEKIYHNNLTRTIFDHIMRQPIFQKVKSIEKL